MKKSESQSSTNKKQNKNHYQLVLLNDDYNTFDFVIQTLELVLGYESIQAEQIATIAHFNQECSIKSGSLSLLEILKDKLDAKGLSSKIIL
jgi:ATP-dependent Clp protease adaptor protein ClpS